MSTPKKRKAIAPASKPSSRKPISTNNLTKRSAVSTEYVRDSDSDSNSNSSPEEDSDGSTEESDSEKGQKSAIKEAVRPENAAKSSTPHKSMTKEKQIPVLPLSNGAPRVNGKILAHASSSGSEDSDSGSSESGGQSTSEEEEESSREKDRSSGVEGKSSGSDDESSEEDSTEEESDSSESGGELSQAVQTSQSHTRSEIPSRPYKTPPGFEKVKISSGSLVSRKLSNKELSGKRIWHITAPADVPINQIKEASMQSIANQETVLSYESKDYELVKYDEMQHPTLLLPSAIEGGYQIEPIKFMHSLHLQQKLEAPSTKSTISLPAQQLLQKPVRPQPKGLKMRYKPFGLEFGGPEELDTDSSGETGLPKSRIEISNQNLSTSPARQSSEEVNRRKEISATPNGQSTVKNLSKKRKRDQENKGIAVENVDSDSISVDASPLATKRKKKRKSTGISQSQSSQDLVSGGSPSIVSSQPSQNSKKSKKHRSNEKDRGRPD